MPDSKEGSSPNSSPKQEKQQIDVGTENAAFEADEGLKKADNLCPKCQIEHILPGAVPILNNDRPYSIEVYDCTNQQKIEVLRINLAEDKKTSGIEMGKSILKPMSGNKVAPILDEKSILKDSSLGIKYLQEETKSEAAIEANLGDEDEEESRQQWSNPIEFLLSCVAMSVGLGNVWRFPFTAYENGGGAFLIPYLLVLCFIGRPLYFLELAMGQFASKSSVKIWDMSPFFRGVGYGQAIATSSVVSYYTCLIAMSVFYLIASCQSVLSWTVCDPEIVLNNTICVGTGQNATQLLADGGFDNTTAVIGSAEQYYDYSVLKKIDDISGGIGMPDLKLTACLAACYLVLFLTLWKGVASSGKVAYFTAIFPYLVLFTILGKGVTLPGAIDGIMFFITPQWGELLNVKVWYAAVTQSFFSLSVGFGALFTYSSYNDFKHNVYRDALIISFTDTFTSVLAGFTIFSVLGNLAQELNVPIEDVIKSGQGLAFISYPTAIAKFDYVPQLFAVLFFLMLFTLGLGSATGLISAVIAIVADNRPDWNRTYVAAFVCFSGFLIGLIYITPGGGFILTLVDFYGGGFMIFALAVLEVVAISYVYGMRRVLEDVKFMLDIELGIYWKFCWGYLIPISLSFFFVYFIIIMEPLTYGGLPFPDMALNAGWIIMAFALAQVPLWAIRELCRSPETGLVQKFKGLFRPNEQWGPKNSRTKLEWIKSVTEREMDDVLSK